MSRRRLLTALAAATVAAALAGCGGGGDAAEDAEVTATPAATPTLPTASGASAAEGAGEALAALGTTQAVSSDDVASTLGAYEAFGLPHDLFLPQVTPQETEEEQATAAAGTGAVATVPLAGGGVITAPTGAVPLVPGVTTTAPSVGGTGATTPTTGGATTPVSASGGSGRQQNDRTAYFTIRDTPVTAQEGDTIPPERQELLVSEIRDDGVTLTLVRGLLPNGSDTLRLAIGETAKLIDTQNGQGYTVKLTDVREAQTP